MAGRKMRVILWAAAIIFACCPLGFDLINWLFDEHPPPLLTIIMHGEVLIIAVAIIADTFVRAAGSDDNHRLRMPLMAGCPIVLVLMGYAAGMMRLMVETKSLSSEFVVSRIQIGSAITLAIALILSLTAAITLED